MNFYTWKDSFNIGIEEIDRQHRTFLEYLNACQQQVSGADGSCIDAEMLGRLKEYAASHFRFEEELMQSMGYPEIEHNEQQHKYFEAKIEELGTGLDQGGKAHYESVLAFMRDWFLRHILEEDKKYVPYASKAG